MNRIIKNSFRCDNIEHKINLIYCNDMNCIYLNDIILKILENVIDEDLDFIRNNDEINYNNYSIKLLIGNLTYKEIFL